MVRNVVLKYDYECFSFVVEQCEFYVGDSPSSTFAVHSNDVATGGLNTLDESFITVDFQVTYFVNKLQIYLPMSITSLKTKNARVSSHSIGAMSSAFYKSGPSDYNHGFHFVKDNYNQ
jgi:hypothetical protein